MDICLFKNKKIDEDCKCLTQGNEIISHNFFLFNIHWLKYEAFGGNYLLFISQGNTSKKNLSSFFKKFYFEKKKRI